MPNVTIEGPVDLRQIVIRRPEMFLRDQDGIKRVSEYYINTDCSKLLLEALVIEPGKKQQFFFQVCKKTDGAIIRLEPISEAEKTPGVKRLMGQVAFAIRSLFPGSRYGKNNISARGRHAGAHARPRPRGRRVAARRGRARRLPALQQREIGRAHV